MEEPAEGTDGAYLFVAADDGTLPLRPGQTCAEVLAERYKLELPSYYTSIQHLTFETEFVNVSEEVGESWRIWNRSGVGSSKLSALRAQVDEKIKGFTGRAFVRMSTRSPKDAIDKIPRLRKQLVVLLREQFSALMASHVGVTPGEAYTPTANDQLCALDNCMGELMSVTSGDEAFELMMYSSRCVSDLIRLLDYRDHLPCWDLQIVIRQYVSLPAACEYRCFVHQKQLTAISQYFASSYYPDVVADQNITKQRVVEFYQQQCFGVILLDDYVLDLAVLPQGGVYIIELNPFSSTTGSCLFDWDKDSDLLKASPLPPRPATTISNNNSPDAFADCNKRGNRDVVMRVVEEPLKHLDVYLMPWRDILKESLQLSTASLQKRTSASLSDNQETKLKQHISRDDVCFIQ
jgi:hypothetical protein